MDRLYALIIFIVAFGIGCDQKAKADKPKPKSRVNAVVAKKNTGEAPEDFCDVYSDVSDAKGFRFPPLNQDGVRLGDGGWTWVNVWATWCKPCIEEMPRMLEWRKEIDGLSSIVFLSADDTDEVLTQFSKKHPNLGSSHPRIVEGLKEWNLEMGFDAAAPLPLHLFVDASNKVRCVRAGGVSEHNQAAVARLVTE